VVTRLPLLSAVGAATVVEAKGAAVVEANGADAVEDAAASVVAVVVECCMDWGSYWC
jgi:hypothetical protein